MFVKVSNMLSSQNACVFSSIKVQWTFNRGFAYMLICHRTAAQNGAPIFYLLFLKEAFHFMGSTHLNKEEGRDYPASALPPGGKQAS